MLNVRKMQLSVTSVSVFKNPHMQGKECIVLTLCDSTMKITERNTISLFDVYEGNVVYKALVDDLIKSNNPFPKINIEGSLYGYGKKLNLANYLGIL